MKRKVNEKGEKLAKSHKTEARTAKSCKLLTQTAEIMWK